ncbi:unnamed protein product [Ceratitis capitata]|uniref:(Mediterranean fruit fly) hypothetical protein n=1 Tax=Ceratitis capitata TaxID=7213 RepID=A0A811UT11_CERCA|nr:unnamed protein product [Ceratitis capitata]
MFDSKSVDVSINIILCLCKEEGDKDVITARPRRMSEVITSSKIQPIPEGSSFFIMSQTNRFRIFCHWLCNHSNFGNVILCCIMFSSAMLAAEDPLKSNADRNQMPCFLNRVWPHYLFSHGTLANGILIFPLLKFEKANILCYVLECFLWFAALILSGFLLFGASVLLHHCPAENQLQSASALNHV